MDSYSLSVFLFFQWHVDKTWQHLFYSNAFLTDRWSIGVERPHTLKVRWNSGSLNVNNLLCGYQNAYERLTSKCSDSVNLLCALLSAVNYNKCLTLCQCTLKNVYFAGQEMLRVFQGYDNNETCSFLRSSLNSKRRTFQELFQIIMRGINVTCRDRPNYKIFCYPNGVFVKRFKYCQNAFNGKVVIIL